MPELDRAPLDGLRARACRVLDDVALFRWRLAGVVLVVGVGVVVYAFSRVETYVPTPEDVASMQSTTTVSTSTTQSPRVVVSVAGAVNRPGLYTMQLDARIADVIQAAGGVTAEADLDRINLAAKVADGERVYIVRTGQVAPEVIGDPQTAGSETSSIIDLNSATAEQLDSLPGIGPATARAIVQHRQQHGPFRSVDDLTAVKGIGPSKLAQLKDLVRVRG